MPSTAKIRAVSTIFACLCHSSTMNRLHRQARWIRIQMPTESSKPASPRMEHTWHKPIGRSECQTEGFTTCKQPGSTPGLVKRVSLHGTSLLSLNSDSKKCVAEGETNENGLHGYQIQNLLTLQIGEDSNVDNAAALL